MGCLPLIAFAISLFIQNWGAAIFWGVCYALLYITSVIVLQDKRR